MKDSLPWMPMNHLQNLTPLALSLVEKSITIQTNKKHKNSKQYIHILLIGMCGQQNIKARFGCLDSVRLRKRLAYSTILGITQGIESKTQTKAKQYMKYINK